MNSKDEPLSISERLGRALDRGQLPAGGPAEAAERLIERMERQTRVALLGLSKAGKTGVLNLLAGEPVVPEGLELPTLMVQRGTRERMICTLGDGSSETIEGSDLRQCVALNPALVTLERDMAVLSVISLLEVAPGATDQDQRRAMAWASKRADILVWCSTAFLPKEQVLWEGLPDAVKDNGFLLLTKTDLLGGKEAVSGIVKRIEHRAGLEFREVLSISTQAAARAVKPDGTIDRTLFRDSGAASIISAIKARVDLARQADTDTAEALLARHTQAAPKQSARRPPSPVSEIYSAPIILEDHSLPELVEHRPEPVSREQPRVPSTTQAPEPGNRPFPPPPSFAAPTFTPPKYQPPTAPPSTLISRPVGATPKIVAQTEEPRPQAGKPPSAQPRPPPLLLVPKVGVQDARPRVRIAARPTVPVVAPTREAISPEDRVVVNAAVTLLMSNAADLSAQLGATETVPMGMVLDHSLAATQQVGEILAQSDAQEIRRIASDLGEVQDLMTLMQLEKGAAPADDALTLLLQIRRDLETLLAA